MADKKAAKAAKKAAKGQEKKGKVGLIILIAFIAVVGGFVLLTAFNVFGLRDDVVMPFLRNVPLIGSFITDADDPLVLAARREEELTERGTELETRIAQLEAQIESERAQVDEANRNMLELNRLREMERGHNEHLANREAFERALAEGNIDDFTEWFETIHEELAILIYEELTADTIAGYRRQHYLNVWAEMTPTAVSNAIMARDMVTTNMPLLVSVFRDMNARDVALILNALPDSDARGAILTHFYSP